MAPGPARAQTIAPAGSGVTIHKLAIESGLAHTVKYFVTGGSPRLQALVRRVEWAENELSVIEQLQLLKLDTVVNERRVAAFRTAQLTNPYYQLTNPYYPPGCFPLCIATGNGCDGPSSLQRALEWQLACEATPEAALQLIGFLEHLQTELDAELKALPPQEQEVIKGPIDALRPKVAALPRSDVPPVAAPPKAPVTEAVAAPQVKFPTQAIPQQHSMPLDTVAFQQRVRQNQERVRQQIRQRQQQVGFPTQAVPQQLSMPLDPLGIQQMVRQQFMQVQQQIMQRH
jgi:hypothetical protein